MATRDNDWVTATLATMKVVAGRWHGAWIQVGDMAAARVESCPAQAVWSEWPGWSSALAARQIGLAAVRTGVLDARDAVRAAFDALLEDADASREFQRVQDWLVDLSRPARLDVADEALRWLVAWRSIGPDAPPSAVVDRGAVTAKITKEVGLRASADLLIRNPGESDYTAYVSIGGATSTSDDRETVGRLAAVLWFAGTSVSTVVVLHPKSREARTLAVDVDLVSRGAEQFLAAMRAMIDQSSGSEEAPAVPGSQCRWCDRRGACVAGRGYLAGIPEVSGGLPVRLQRS